MDPALRFGSLEESFRRLGASEDLGIVLMGRHGSHAAEARDLVDRVAGDRALGVRLPTQRGGHVGGEVFQCFARTLSRVVADRATNPERRTPIKAQNGAYLGGLTRGL